MRRIAMFVAISWVCIPAIVMAGQFDQLSNRLKQYDDEPFSSRGNRQNDVASYQEDMVGEPLSEDADAVWDDPTPAYSGAWNGWQDGPPRGFWGRSEILYWWVRGSNTPPLVTTSPQGTPQAEAGVLPNATVLFGDGRLNQQGRAGGRFTLGYWFDDCERSGIEGSFLILANAKQSFHASSNGTPILARPFFNVLTDQQDTNLIAFPSIVVGTINATTSRQVLGGDVNLRRALYADDCRRVDVLAGYRFFHFAEGLNVATQSTSVDQQGTIPVGTQFSILDNFGTRNQFNGGQLGLNSQYMNGRWTVDFLAKIALGAVNQRVTIDGSTTVAVPGSAAVTNPGGILALGSNIGNYSRNQFAVLPEFSANLHYQLTPLWRANVGYTLLVLTNVVRPGDQIDTRLDPNQFPPSTGGTFPKFAFHNADVWMQGINLGLECNF